MTNMLSAKISREFNNNGISTPSIDKFRPSRVPYLSFSSQHRCQNPSLRVIELSSLAYPYFELDIKKDQILKALLSKQELDEFNGFARERFS